MNINLNSHNPVLAEKALAYLPKKNNLNIIDATFGGGGYSKLILKKDNINNLIAIDRDPSVREYSKNIENKNNFILLEGQFSKIDLLVSDYMKEKKIDGFDAIFFDLGISFNQIQDSKRGFSFNLDGPLDMRMEKKGFSAYDLINKFSEEKLADIIFKYGEERFAKSIAKKIVEKRNFKSIESTEELSTIIKNTVGVLSKKRLKKNPSTKTFQSLRIFVNNELEEIKEALTKSEKLLVPGGRIIVVSFHSLEDRLVKEFFNHKSGKKWRSSRHNPEPSETGKITLKIITKKAIKPDDNEVSTNPRSRSAKLRVAEKLELNFGINKL